MRPSDRPAAHGLPDLVRRPMEALLGTDLRTVRVHVASPEAVALGAHAFARGDDVHFAPGAWDQWTPRGWRVLGHEFAHVVQQRLGRVRPAHAGGVVRDPALEREADAVGAAAAAMRRTRTTPAQPWYEGAPACHAGIAAVQCLMKSEAFTADTTTAKKPRDALIPIDKALAQFHWLNGVKPRNYVELSARLQDLYSECRKYVQKHPTGQPLPGVKTLMVQIAHEETLYLPLADFQRATDATKKWDALERAQETALYHKNRSSVDFPRKDLEELEDQILRLIDDWDTGAQLSGDDGRIVQQEIDALISIAERSTLPAVLRSIILECTAAGNVRQLDLKSMTPGLTYNSANGGTQKYTLNHYLRAPSGKKLRMGSLLHELTHLSIAETFDNTVLMLAIRTTATDAEILQLARARTLRIARLTHLITSATGISEEQRFELKEKCKYPVCGKLGYYLTNFRPRLGDMFTRLQLLIAPGLDCQLIEYDTVINQMSLWCHLWGLPEQHPVYAELLVQAQEAFDYRTVERQRRRPRIPLLDLSRVHREDGSRVAQVPRLDLRGLRK